MSSKMIDHGIATDFIEFAGKGSLAGTIVLKTFGFIGIIDVNNILTVILTVAAILYTSFRAWNEFDRLLVRRKKRKAANQEPEEEEED